MSKIDLEVFTNEIDKTYTILKQNLVMIDTIKELITNGNLNEDDIKALQAKLANLTLDYAQFKGTTQDNLTSQASALQSMGSTIESMNKVIPTDIDVNTNGELVLEHDGKVITGQTKKVKPLVVDTISTNQKYVINKDIIFGTDETSSIYIIESEGTIYFDGNEGNAYMTYHKNPNEFGGIEFSGLVDDEGVVGLAFLDFNTNEDQFILTDKNVRTLFGNQSIYGDGNIDLYKYTLRLNVLGISGTFYSIVTIYSSKNINVNSVTDFNTLVSATNDKSIISCLVAKTIGNESGNYIGDNIRFKSGVWNIYRDNVKIVDTYQGSTSPLVVDTVETLLKETI